MFRASLLIRALLVFVVLASPSSAAGSSADGKPVRDIPGPVPARVIRVIDGDTVVVDATPWPGHTVRLRGIDAPETRSRCPAVKAAGYRAKAALGRMLEAPEPVLLRNISGGKYYGRVLADISVGDHDTALDLLDRGLVHTYAGGRRPKRTCPQT